MATKIIAWNTGSGNITLTYQGQGDGPISIQSDVNNGNARSQVIIVETVGGAITRNFTINQAACPFPVGDIRNFAYTGSYQEVELPAGQYKLQCWGAQGGSNAAASSYGITAKAGGKGGYSEGIITLTTKTTVRVYVGGAGSSSAGGFNGGGSTSGSSSYSSNGEQGVSRMGGGGGATDIRLSDGALLSRIIVAGGGSGGAMCYKNVSVPVPGTPTSYNSSGTLTHAATSGTVWWDINELASKCLELRIASGSPSDSILYVNHGSGYKSTKQHLHMGQNQWLKFDFRDVTAARIYFTSSDATTIEYRIYNSLPSIVTVEKVSSSYTQATIGAFWTSDYTKINYRNSSNSSLVFLPNRDTSTIDYSVGWPITTDTIYIIDGYKYTWDGSKLVQETTTETSNSSQVGYVGGGTNGGGYSSTYYGKQNGAGSGGSFGQGAAQSVTNHRYCSGAGGGGWYGGGSSYSDSSMNTCKYSGGGSGFVNTAASAGNRPSGYTGLQLDSGETKAGNTSFPSTSGETETGHSGNGYARITRLS